MNCGKRRIKSTKRDSSTKICQRFGSEGEKWRTRAERRKRILKNGRSGQKRLGEKKKKGKSWRKEKYKKRERVKRRKREIKKIGKKKSRKER